jgi:hypothetical protein
VIETDCWSSSSSWSNQCRYTLLSGMSCHCHSFRYQSCVVTTPLGWSGCSTGRVESGCRPELARHCLQSSPCRPCARRTRRSCMHIDTWQRKTTQQSGQVRSCQVRTWSGQVRWQDSPALSADAIAKWNVTRGMTIGYRWWDDAAVRLYCTTQCTGAFLHYLVTFDLMHPYYIARLRDCGTDRGITSGIASL